MSYGLCDFPYIGLTVLINNQHISLSLRSLHLCALSPARASGDSVILDFGYFLYITVGFNRQMLELELINYWNTDDIDGIDERGLDAE